MKRILLVKTSSMGDVIHNLPVVNDLLQHYPSAQIDWVVEESFAQIPRLHPKVGQVFMVAFRRWRQHLMNKNTWKEIYQFKNQLASNRYDAIIDTQGLIKSAVVCKLAHGVKHGYDRQSIREPFASHFYDVTHSILYQQHAVVRNRTLAAKSLGYATPKDAPDYGIATIKGQAIDVDIQAFNLPKNFIIGLHGTSKEGKLWPENHWILLGEQLSAQQISLVLPWSNSAEQQRAERIAQKANNVVVLPKLSITTLSHTIVRAQAAIGVDTGLSHLAAALDVPTIAIYTDSNPDLTGVMAGNFARAVNLGGKQMIPSVEEVLKQLMLNTF